MATALGLDFGTTNTVLAQAGEGGETDSIVFNSPAGTGDTMRTALGYMKQGRSTQDLVVEAGLKPYDVGGLIPLIEEAGGVITTWSGDRPENGGSIIAAGSADLHAAALDVLNRAE